MTPFAYYSNATNVAVATGKAVARPSKTDTTVEGEAISQFCAGSPISSASEMNVKLPGQ